MLFLSANHRTAGQLIRNQLINTVENPCCRRKARENPRDVHPIGFVFAFDWLRNENCPNLIPNRKAHQYQFEAKKLTVVIGC